MKIGLASAALSVLLVATCATALGAEKDKEYGFLTRERKGVGAAVTYESAPSKSQGQVQGSSAPVSVAHDHSLAPTLIANRCTGLTSENSFSEFSNSTTCTSFAAPAPPTVAGAAPARPPRRSPEQIATALAQRSIALAPRPQLKVAPSGVGLTGLDSFFWLAEEPRPITASAGAVTAEARPSQYVWDFDDGGHKTTSTSGRAWRPRRPGSIAHLYEARGTYGVTVDVIWQARWRIGTGPWRPLGFFTTSDSVDYPVRQVVALLVKPR